MPRRLLEDFGFGLPRWQCWAKGLARERGKHATEESLVEVFETKANVLQWTGGEQAALVLLLLGGEVSGRGQLDRDLVLGLGGVGEGLVEVERKQLGRTFEATKRGLGFVELLVGEASRGGADAGLALNELEFQALRSAAASARAAKFFRMRLPSSQPATRWMISPEEFVNSEMMNAETWAIWDLPRQLANPKSAFIKSLQCSG